MRPVGAQAPDFTLKDQNGQRVTLSDYRGDKNVLLVFFPLAFTGICQGELDEIRDHLPNYQNDEHGHPDDLRRSAAHAQGLGAAERIPVPAAVRLLAARRGG